MICILCLYNYLFIIILLLFVIICILVNTFFKSSPLNKTASNETIYSHEITPKNNFLCVTAAKSAIRRSFYNLLKRKDKKCDKHTCAARKKSCCECCTQTKNICKMEHKCCSARKISMCDQKTCPAFQPTSCITSICPSNKKCCTCCTQTKKVSLARDSCINKTCPARKLKTCDNRNCPVINIARTSGSTATATKVLGVGNSNKIRLRITTKPKRKKSSECKCPRLEITECVPNKDLATDEEQYYVPKVLMQSRRDDSSFRRSVSECRPTPCSCACSRTSCSKPPCKPDSVLTKLSQRVEDCLERAKKFMQSPKKKSACDCIRSRSESPRRTSQYYGRSQSPKLSTKHVFLPDRDELAAKYYNKHHNITIRSTPCPYAQSGSTSMSMSQSNRSRSSSPSSNDCKCYSRTPKPTNKYCRC